MTEPVEVARIYEDRTGWGAGPWDDEPDRVLWTDPITGYPCLARRSPGMGHWCGYVGVPPGHPAHGESYDDVDVMVHGGITFAEECDGDPEQGICHPSDDGDHVWWVGFDCMHAGDASPLAFISNPYAKYRSLTYVKDIIKLLAIQLAALALGANDGS